MNQSKNITAAEFRIAVMLSGRGSNFAAILNDLETHWPRQGGVEGTPENKRNSSTLSPSPSPKIVVCAAVSDKPQAPGLVFARERQIPIHIVERRPKERSNEDFNSELAHTLTSHSPDLIVLAGFMRVLSSDFIKHFRGRIINIHPSLLPAFRGIDAQQQAIDAGVQYSGATVHLVVEELDSGPILLQKIVPVYAGDSRTTLTDRILLEEHAILPEVIRALAAGRIVCSAEEDGSVRVLRNDLWPSAGEEALP